MIGFIPANWDATNSMVVFSKQSYLLSAQSFSGTPSIPNNILNACHIADTEDSEESLFLMQHSEQSLTEMWNDPAENIWDNA